MTHNVDFAGVSLDSERRVARRHPRGGGGAGAGGGLRSMVAADIAYGTNAFGLHTFQVLVETCPTDHRCDPLEVGLLSQHADGGFRGCGYSTEGCEVGSR